MESFTEVTASAVSPCTEPQICADMDSSSVSFPAPSTPLGATRVKTRDHSSSKRRRLRWLKLVEGREREAAQVQVSQLQKQLDELSASSSAQLREFSAKLQAMSGEPDVAAQGSAPSGATEHSMPKSLECPRCSTELQAIADPCWCYDVCCLSCDAIAILCECQKQALCFKSGDTCDYVEHVRDSTLANLKNLGFHYGEERREDDWSCQSCTQCEHDHLSLGLNCLNGRHVCGVCNRVDNQLEMVPCSAKNCVGAEEAIFHKKCVVKTGPDLYTCRACLLAGSTLDSSDSSVTGEISDSDADGEYRTVDAHEGLVVGMQLGAGHVGEIWPGIDRFMVHIQRSSGTEIQHFSISKDAARLMNKQRARDTVDATPQQERQDGRPPSSELDTMD